MHLDWEITGREGESELARVTAVHELNLLDTLPGIRFHELIRHLKARFQVPVAEINLLDWDRQFTWAPRISGQSPDTPRAQSFCDLTIEQSSILVVPDATADPRFSWKDTVTGPRHIRFYAGAPLQYNGYPIGTLCIADTVPREFGEIDRAALQQLSERVKTAWQSEPWLQFPKTYTACR